MKYTIVADACTITPTGDTIFTGVHASFPPCMPPVDDLLAEAPDAPMEDVSSVNAEPRSTLDFDMAIAMKLLLIGETDFDGDHPMAEGFGKD